MDTFLQNVLDNLAPELERTGNTLAQVELTPATVLADERLLRQAVTNVLLNASKHAPGSAITVRASVAPDGSHVDVAITDNGPGVPEESLGRIFEVFYRTDPSRTAASGGSGLGLAIVQRAMRAVGNEATAGKPHGLRVILTLRVTGRKPPKIKHREASAGQDLDRRGRRGHRRARARRYLESHGFDTALTADGRKGLSLALGGGFDLVILDLMLPGEDGLSVCRSIRERSGIPVIMVTARSEDIDVFQK